MRIELLADGFDRESPCLASASQSWLADQFEPFAIFGGEPHRHDRRARDRTRPARAAYARSATRRRDGDPAGALFRRACGNFRNPPGGGRRVFISSCFSARSFESSSGADSVPASGFASAARFEFAPTRSSRGRRNRDSAFCVCVRSRVLRFFRIFGEKLGHESNGGDHALVVHAHGRQNAERSLHLVSIRIRSRNQREMLSGVGHFIEAKLDVHRLGRFDAAAEQPDRAGPFLRWLRAVRATAPGS